MQYTLILGAPVVNGDHTFGSLTRIVLENGVANQLVVSPSGLFSGPDRLVPIDCVMDTSADAITLKATEEEWKSFNAFKMDMREVAPLVEDRGMQLAPQTDISQPMVQQPTTDAVTSTITVADTTVVLTKDTVVGSGSRFGGLITETGVPQSMLVDGQMVPFKQVSLLDEKHIELGGAASAPETLDPTRDH